MSSRTRPRPSRFLPLIAVAIAIVITFGLALLLADPLPLQALRNGLFDQYQRWHPRAYQPVPVRIIDIDEASLAKLGQWPWPRTRLADLVDRLNASGVAAIGFDVVFAEKDRTSPAIAADSWSLDANLRAALAKLPDHDQAFAQSIGRAPVVVGFTLDHAPDREQATRPPLRQPARPYRYINAGGPANRWLHTFSTATTSLPIFERAAQGNGAFSFVPDSDGVVRRSPMVLGLGEEAVPSLAAELLRVGLGERNYFLKTAEEKNTGLAEIRIGQYRIPTNEHGEMWLHFSDAVAERDVPAWKVLDGQVPAALLENHLVLVGTSAPGLMDLRFSPLGRIVPGVEVHAQAIEQVLSGHFLQRPSWATAAEAIAIVIGTLLVGILSLRINALIAAILSALVLAGLMGGGWYAFHDYGLLLNTVTPALVLLATFVLFSLIHHYASEREQRWIKAAFSRYVSPNRVRHLVDNPADMDLGGHRQECSFIFTDLAGFTHLMESIDPADAVALLNAYLEGMIGIAFRHEGTLDRIVGDAVAIMFSAPVPQPDHRARALACAMEMDDFASRYALELQAKGVDFGNTRIGIHSGDVIVGNFGGSTIFDYRALGDAVNTASRLESANKYLGTTICVSEATLSGCSPSTVVRPVGRLLLKGKSQSLQVYEPVLPSRAVSYAPQNDYLEAYQLMADGESAAQTNEDNEDSPALRLFQDMATRFPDDPLVAMHLKRLLGGAHGDLIVMSEK